MPCAAGELCLVPARTPERPDGHECRGKCGGRLHRRCSEADPDCDNPMSRVCHDCLAAKRSSKGKGETVKPQAGKRKALDTGGVGAGPWKQAKSETDNTGHGGGAPPAYVELSSHFVSLESAAEACGNDDASFYLQKARMSFIKVHASKPAQQADMRPFCEPQQGQGEWHSGGLVQ